MLGVGPPTEVLPLRILTISAQAAAPGKDVRKLAVKTSSRNMQTSRHMFYLGAIMLLREEGVK